MDTTNQEVFMDKETAREVLNFIIHKLNKEVCRYLPTEAMRVQESNDTNLYGEYSEYFDVDAVYEVIEDAEKKFLSTEAKT